MSATCSLPTQAHPSPSASWMWQTFRTNLFRKWWQTVFSDQQWSKPSHLRVYWLNIKILASYCLGSNTISAPWYLWGLSYFPYLCLSFLTCIQSLEFWHRLEEFIQTEWLALSFVLNKYLYLCSLIVSGNTYIISDIWHQLVNKYTTRASTNTITHALCLYIIHTCAYDHLHRGDKRQHKIGAGWCWMVKLHILFCLNYFLRLF